MQNLIDGRQIKSADRIGRTVARERLGLETRHAGSGDVEDAPGRSVAQKAEAQPRGIGGEIQAGGPCAHALKVNGACESADVHVPDFRRPRETRISDSHERFGNAAVRKILPRAFPIRVFGERRAFQWLRVETCRQFLDHFPPRRPQIVVSNPRGIIGPVGRLCGFDFRVAERIRAELRGPDRGFSQQCFGLLDEFGLARGVVDQKAARAGGVRRFSAAARHASDQRFVLKERLQRGELIRCESIIL